MWEDFLFKDSYDGDFNDTINEVKLPKEYIKFMKLHNGGLGFKGGQSLELFNIEELQEINKDYFGILPNENIVIGSYNKNLIGLNSKGQYFIVPKKIMEDKLIIISESIENLPVDINCFFNNLVVNAINSDFELTEDQLFQYKQFIILCEINGNFVSSTATLKKDCIDFSFSLGDKEIVENDVRGIHMYYKSNDLDKYIKHPMAFENTLLTKDDLKDFYLLIFTTNKAKIYHNFKLIMEFDSSYVYDYLIDNKQNFILVLISQKYNNTYFIIGENYYTSDTLNMSFYDWCITFNKEDLLKYYSPTNMDASKIKCNSKQKVLWECDNGHSWKESLYSFVNSVDFCRNRVYICCNECKINTFMNDYENILNPKPGELPSNAFTNRENFKLCKLCKLVEYWRNHYNCYSIQEIFEKLCEDCKVVNSHLENRKYVINHPKNSSDIIAEFEYPMGKDGDVNMYLANTYGKILCSEGTKYTVAFPASEIEAIGLLAASKEIVQFNDTFYLYQDDTRFNFLTESHYYYLKNLIDDSIKELCDEFMLLRPKDIPLGKIRYSFGVMCPTLLSHDRYKIYEQLIAEGKTNSRWKNEQRLYSFVKKYYPDAIYQYRKDWLDTLSLDIYIPSKKIGIEYQGEQHYYPIEFFGGEEGLRNRQRNDKKKKDICKKNNVKLIEWSYEKEINEETVKDMFEKLR